MSGNGKRGTAAGMGAAFWFAGWLFTIAFMHLIWWQIIVGIVVWPFFLGLGIRDLAVR
jgi:hypothetical protein